MTVITPALIKLAHFMADEAGKIALQYFRRSFTSQLKPDQSPVTEADLAIEARLREILAHERPQDGIFGEEFENKKSENGLTWVIDPIDGTNSFSIGRPTFGTLIGLCENDAPVLGIIDQAITKERWFGCAGHATTLNNKIIKVRPCPDISAARIGLGAPNFIADFYFSQLKQKAYSLHYNGDCYFYGLLAAGFMNAVIEDGLKPFDFIALAPIIKGAGGFITDWHGHDLNLSSNGQVLAAGSKELYQTLTSLLSSK